MKFNSTLLLLVFLLSMPAFATTAQVADSGSSIDSHSDSNPPRPVVQQTRTSRKRSRVPSRQPDSAPFAKRHLSKSQFSGFVDKAKEATKSLSMAALGALALYKTSNAETVFETLKSAAGSMGGQAVLAGYFAHQCRQTLTCSWEALSSLNPYRAKSPEGLRLNALYEKYNQQRMQYTEGSQKTIEALLEAASGHVLRDPQSEALRLLSDALDHIFAVRTGMHDQLPLIIDKDKLDDVLMDCPAKLRASLEDLVGEIYVTLMGRPSMPPVSSNKEGRSFKTLYYFRGPAATGKSYMAEDLMQSLGFDPVVISLAGVTDLSFLVGGGSRGGDVSPEGRLVEIWEKARRSGKPPVVIFDEAGEILALPEDSNTLLKSWVRDLSDPAKRTMRLAGLQGVELNLDGAIIIFTGVLPMVDDQLISRIPEIEFPGFSVEEKTQIGMGTIQAFLSDYSEDLTQGILDEQIEMAVREGVRNDVRLGNPGVRVLQRVLARWAKYELRKQTPFPPTTEFSWEREFAKHKSYVRAESAPRPAFMGGTRRLFQGAMFYPNLQPAVPTVPGSVEVSEGS